MGQYVALHQYVMSYVSLDQRICMAVIVGNKAMAQMISGWKGMDFGDVRYFN